VTRPGDPSAEPGGSRPGATQPQPQPPTKVKAKATSPLGITPLRRPGAGQPDPDPELGVDIDIDIGSEIAAGMGGDGGAHAASQAALAAGSKSFRLAGRLLSRRASNDAAVCYAWCRRADDLVDDGADPAVGVRRLRDELDRIYSDVPVGPRDVVLAAFQELVRRRRIPRAYPAALVAGFAMDAAGARYRAPGELELYCYRVAGVVGLMMTHVLGVHDDRCLPAAARLGMAMQLTNIGRDVLEDWRRGRLYLPSRSLGLAGARHHVGVGRLPRQPPEGLRAPLAEGVRLLLGRAERYYRAAREGFIDLPWRSSFAIRVAALVYAEIGRELERREFDVLAGRAVVPGWRKGWLVLRAGLAALAELPTRCWYRLRRWRGGAATTGVHIPVRELRFPDDVALGE
jgi:phytoene synthase